MTVFQMGTCYLCVCYHFNVFILIELVYPCSSLLLSKGPLKKRKVWDITLWEAPGLWAELCKLLWLCCHQCVDVNASHSWRLSPCCEIHQKLFFSGSSSATNVIPALRTSSSWPKFSQFLPECEWPLSPWWWRHVSGLYWKGGGHICLLLGSVAAARSMNPGRDLELCFRSSCKVPLPTGLCFPW